MIDCIGRANSWPADRKTITCSIPDRRGIDNLIVVTQNCVPGPTPLTYLTCAHNTVGVGGETLSFPVTAGKSYSVLVDGAGITKYEGVFRLTLSIK